jgi:hypothetical protein
MLKTSFALLFVALPSFAFAECELDTDMITGIISEVDAEHPNGTTFTAFVMKAEDVILVPEFDGTACTMADFIQIDPADDETEAALRASLGKTVTIRTPDLFEAHTAWHISEAVAMEARLVTP